MSTADPLPSYVGTTETPYTIQTLEAMNIDALIAAATTLSEKNSQSIKDLTTKLEQSAKTQSEIIKKTFNPKKDDPVIQILDVPPSNQLDPAPSTTFTTSTTPSIRSLLQKPQTIPVLSSKGLQILQQTSPVAIADKPPPSLQQPSAPSAKQLGIQLKPASIPRGPNPLSPAKAATSIQAAARGKAIRKQVQANAAASPPPPPPPAPPPPPPPASSAKADLPVPEPEPEQYRNPLQQLQIRVGQTLGINADDDEIKKTLEAALELANYDVDQAYNFIKEDASAQKQQLQQQEETPVPRTTEKPLKIDSTDGKETYIDIHTNEKFQKIRIMGDGSCFFRAVAVGLSPGLQAAPRNSAGLGSTQNIQEVEVRERDTVKEKIIDYIRINWDEMKDFYPQETFKSISEKIKHPKYNAEATEILAFANAYKRHLIIYDMSNEDVKPITQLNEGGTSKIHLIRTGEGLRLHYDFLKPVQQGGCRTKQKKTSKRTHKKGKSKFHKKRSTIRKRKTHRKRK